MKVNDDKLAIYFKGDAFKFSVAKRVTESYEGFSNYPTARVAEFFLNSEVELNFVNLTIKEYLEQREPFR